MRYLIKFSYDGTAYSGFQKQRGLDTIEKRMEALNRCKGFIRSSLAKKLTIRKTPTLIFVLDDSFERGMKIEKLIKDINK